MSFTGCVPSEHDPANLECLRLASNHDFRLYAPRKVMFLAWTISQQGQSKPRPYGD